MLSIVGSMDTLNFRALMGVYEETNIAYGNLHYANEPEAFRQQLAEEDFRMYLSDCFFRTEGAYYAIWEQDHQYLSAMRIEPYRDGVLIAAMETAPQERGRGYAGKLLTSTLQLLKGTKVYSHVDKKNKASLRVHEKCGFQILQDHAVYLDGSVLQSSYTLCFET